MKNQYKKDFEEDKVEKNIWLQEWNSEHYKTYEHELLKIHEGYQECEKEYVEKKLLPKDKKSRSYFPSDYYQIRNGGMTADFRIKHDKSLNGQVYDVNTGKLEKYFKWLAFSEPFEYDQSKEEIIRQRFDNIKILVQGMKLTT